MSSTLKDLGTGCTKTVAVLGASYGGARAAQVLAGGIPDGWRIVLIDRNSHANRELAVLPKLEIIHGLHPNLIYNLDADANVLPGHEHKAFIPYDNIFHLNNPSASTSGPPVSPISTPHIRLHAHIKSLTPDSVTLSRSFPEHNIPTETVHFDYAIYALGSHLPSPLDLWGSERPFCGSSVTVVPEMSLLSVERKHPKCRYQGMKTEGIAWLKRNQKVVEDSASVLVVGGGALGIQSATDIAAVHPTKQVTLLHSRHRLLPLFDHAMHAEILQSLESLNIEVILGERLDLDPHSPLEPKTNESGQRIFRTLTGREVAADLLLLCTGQTPNTILLKEMDPTTINPHNSMAHILRTMQLGVLQLQREQENAHLEGSGSGMPLSSGSDIPLSSGSGTSIPSGLATPASTPADVKVDVEFLLAALDQITIEDPARLDADEILGDEPLGSSEEFNLESDDGEETPYPHIFVIGDAADAFNALKAGHNAYYQGELAARNIIKLIRRQEKMHMDASMDDEPLEKYTPNAPAIKVSLGLSKGVYQTNGVVGVSYDNPVDQHAAGIWGCFGVRVEKEEDMYA